MRRVIIFLLMIIMMPGLLTGCYDKRELRETAYVLGFGVDKGKAKAYKTTIQIINPNSNGADPSGSSGAGGPNQTTYSMEGDNIFESVRKLSKLLSRKLHYGHTVLLVLGEDLLREEGIYHIMDGIERDSEFRTSASIIIAKNTTAEKFLEQRAILDRFGAMKVQRLLENSEALLGENPDTKLFEVIRTITSFGRNTMINGFEVMQDPLGRLIVLNGLGVFQNGKLIGWLDAQDSRGAMWPLNKVKSTLVSLDVNGRKASVGIETYRTKAKMKAVNSNQKPVIHIDLEVQANVGEVETNINLADPTVILNLEKETEKVIKSEIEHTIELLQDMNSDIIGFGDIVHKYQPKLWKKLGDQWFKTAFSSLDYKVTVDVHIQRIGTRTDSLIRKLEMDT